MMFMRPAFTSRGIIQLCNELNTCLTNSLNNITLPARYVTIVTIVRQST